MTDSNCYGCIQAIKDKKSNDEAIVNKAKEIARNENRTVAVFRNEYGELCICTDGEPPQGFITPNM